MSIADWKLEIIETLKKRIREEGCKLEFVHTPKTAGTYAKHYLNALGIPYLGHNQAKKHPKRLYFTMIRNPVDRFESFLNYRLEKKQMYDFPAVLYHNHMAIETYVNQYDLNYIANNINTPEEFARLVPYRTLQYYTKHVDLCITIDEFLPMLDLLGYDCSTIDPIPKKNVTMKLRGTLNQENRDKLARVYKEDLEIYHFWTRQ